DLKKPGLRFAGLGLMSYAAGIALAAVLNLLPVTPPWLDNGLYLTVLLPSLFWMIATWHLLPEASQHAPTNRAMLALLSVPALLTVVVAVLQPHLTRWLALLVPLLFL